nr:helix-turn-helix transcriptional regulator [Lactococcus petauri]
MSLSELNTLSGVSKATISQFENGKSLVSFDKLEALLESVNILLHSFKILKMHIIIKMRQSSNICMKKT